MREYLVLIFCYCVADFSSIHAGSSWCKWKNESFQEILERRFAEKSSWRRRTYCKSYFSKQGLLNTIQNGLYLDSFGSITYAYMGIWNTLLLLRKVGDLGIKFHGSCRNLVMMKWKITMMTNYQYPRRRRRRHQWMNENLGLKISTTT